MTLIWIPRCTNASLPSCMQSLPCVLCAGLVHPPLCLVPSLLRALIVRGCTHGMSWLVSSRACIHFTYMRTCIQRTRLKAQPGGFKLAILFGRLCPRGRHTAWSPNSPTNLERKQIKTCTIICRTYILPGSPLPGVLSKVRPAKPEKCSFNLESGHSGCNRRCPFSHLTLCDELRGRRRLRALRLAEEATC